MILGNKAMIYIQLPDKGKVEVGSELSDFLFGRCLQRKAHDMLTDETPVAVVHILYQLLRDTKPSRCLLEGPV